MTKKLQPYLYLLNFFVAVFPALWILVKEKSAHKIKHGDKIISSGSH